MKIIFVTGKFPVLSETFIINQICDFIDFGHDLARKYFFCNRKFCML
jgi:hypothetical protein